MDYGLTKSTTKSVIMGASSFGLGAGLGYILGRKKRKKSTKRLRRRKNKSYGAKRVRSRTRRTPYTARKRRDTSHKRIRYTKNGQPYIIQRNGRARFIKKRGARISHKRTGGRY